MVTISRPNQRDDVPGAGALRGTRRAMGNGRIARLGTPVAIEATGTILIALYNGPQTARTWTNNTNWNSSEPLDQWYGVRPRTGKRHES